MTITSCPDDVFFVSMSCCGVSLSFPAFCAWLRNRWMLSKTALRSASNALPSCVVQSMRDAIESTTSGNRARATKLGSKPAFVAASCNSVPFWDWWLASHSLRAATLPGFAAQSSICARS